MGENHFAAVPTAVYGVVLLNAGLAWKVAQSEIIKHDSPHSRLRKAVASDFKGNLSLALYVVAIPLAFVHQAIADALYIGVALMWLVLTAGSNATSRRRPRRRRSAQPLRARITAAPAIAPTAMVFSGGGSPPARLAA